MSQSNKYRGASYASIEDSPTEVRPTVAAHSDTVESDRAPESAVTIAHNGVPARPKNQRSQPSLQRAAHQPESPLETDTTLRPGERIRHFEIIKEIGKGGMGQVFLARDLKLGRKVAIKVLNTRSPAFTRRLLIEARATVRCSHENIVVLHEVGEHSGQPYMVLEYLEGKPLNRLLREGPVPQRRALELMIPVVKALRRAHEFQVVHRDLKPGNIFVTSSGTVKVLDFGIARAFARSDSQPTTPAPDADLGDILATQEDEITGTVAYMAPEQWGVDTIDTRTDLWALGVILWELLAGRHPLEDVGANGVMAEVLDESTRMPSIGAVLPHLHPDLIALVDRCLSKPKDARFGSADEVLEILEGIRQRRTSSSAGECPYPGLMAYQEGDAHRFFGRSKDVAAVTERLRATPLVAIVGPSGVGKSSMIRAGVVPSLRAVDESWEVLTIRPGRHPLSSLAGIVESLASTELRTNPGFNHQAIVQRMLVEPGFFGNFLRTWATHQKAQALLFIDQFEELYTLVDDKDVRTAFVESLAGAADDASSPVRVILSIRADLLDRTAENRRFLQLVTQGLHFLPPPDRTGLAEALTAPLEAVGYSFESPQIVARMLDDLDNTQGALPLLQFAAGKLWESRDQTRKMLTSESYDAIGGVSGALAIHADQVVAQLPPSLKALVRDTMLRLVTPEGTREIADLEDLEALSEHPDDVRSLIDVLANERLVIVRSDGTSVAPVVELVHESLISSWPTLRRWREESHEDTFFLEQLRTAAKQWESRGRPKGLLWRGEAADDARRFVRRFTGELTAREKEFLESVLALANQTVRRRRRIVAAVIVLLLGAASAAGVGMLQIREAEMAATAEAERANTALVRMQEKEEQRLKAENAASAARAEVAVGEQALAKTNQQLRDALDVAEAEKQRSQEEAEKASNAAREARVAKKSVEKLLAEQRQRLREQEKHNRELKRKLKKLGTTLK